MAQAIPSGEYSNGPRAARTTGRSRQTLINNRSKGSAGLPSPQTITSLNSQLAALYLQYQSQLASMKGQRRNIKSDYMSRLAQLKQSGVANMTAAEGNAVSRGVLGGSSDVKARLGIEANLASETEQALLDKQGALAQLDQTKISSTGQYLTALAELRAQKTAAMAEATIGGYSGGFYDTAENYDWVGDGQNGQVWMRQNREALQPFYDIAGSATANDTETWKRVAKNIASQFFGWSGEDFAAINSIIMRESKWDPNAANKTSSARGIPQTMMSVYFGDNWKTSENAQRFQQDPVWQIVWLMNYIKGRYGTPQAALAFKDANGWY